RRTYEALIASPQERELFGEWAATWDKYKQGVDQVLALSRKEAGQYAQAAHDLNSKTVNRISVDADALLKKDIDLNNTGAAKAAADAESSYDSAFMWLATILGLTVVVGSAVGMYLIRDVSSGIASIVKPMQALGAGDLAADVPHRGEKTEIGTMAD